MLRQWAFILPVVCAGLAASFAQAGAISPFAEAVLELEPVSYWRLGELTGGTAFDVTALNNGTYHDATLGQPGSVLGDSDTSVYFDGHTTRVEIPHSDEYLLDNGTIIFCFQDQNGVHDTGLFSKDSLEKDEGGHLTIGTTEDGRVTARLQSNYETYLTETSPFIELDTWYFVAFTFGDQGMNLYLNGELVGTNPYTGGTGTTSGGAGNTEPIVLGASQMWTDPDQTALGLRNYFSGLIDEVAVFDQALTDDQVHDLFGYKLLPEPGTVTLIIIGVGSLCGVRRRRAV